MDAAARQKIETVSQLLLKAGNQHGARLLSLVDEVEIGTGELQDPTTVVLRVRPLFLGLFRPADLDAIAAGFSQLKVFGRQNDAHRVTVAPALADPFAPTDLGSGTETMQLCDAIAEALHPVSAHKLPDVCHSFGLADGDSDEAMGSKRAYVRHRISDWTLDQLLRLGNAVVEQHYLPFLWALLQVSTGNRTGVMPAFKNLIFAADGPKPELRLVDAVSNTIEITKNAQFCLVYDRPLTGDELTWADLVTWWAASPNGQGASGQEAARQLWRRLWRSLDRDRAPDADPGPERQMFRVYGEVLAKYGDHLPALIPQVYLHYDPYTRSRQRTVGPLPRQRMDFLMLMRGRRRLVLECDGKQHYADGRGQASPRLYAQMVAADRELHLAGYEIVRFGGAEFQSAEEAGTMLHRYFVRLLAAHGYHLADNEA
jgi:hypothetical protein